MKLTLKSYPLRDARLSGWHDEISGKWDYERLLQSKEWVDGWISFDALAWNSADRRVYCGLNSIDGDLLYAFDPATEKFTSLDAKRFADAYDVKIHRTILRNPADDCYYFGTSLLHDANRQQEAPGGKLVRYDWRKDEYEVLGIPFPHLYVQSIALDAGRGILYAFTYPAEFVIRFDLAEKRSRILGYVGNAIFMSQPHNGVVDKHGRLWGTYAETRAWDETPGTNPVRLFSYDPETDRTTYYSHGLARRADTQQLVPDPEGVDRKMLDFTESRHAADYGFCDSMCYDRDRYIYAGSVSGALSRIDVTDGSVLKVANVVPTNRCPALAFGPDGALWGGGGIRGKTVLFRYDPASGDLQFWQDLRDPATGEAPARIHELVVADNGDIWFGENDNHHRSSYLWRATPDFQ